MDFETLEAESGEFLRLMFRVIPFRLPAKFAV